MNSSVRLMEVDVKANNVQESLNSIDADFSNPENLDSHIELTHKKIKQLSAAVALKNAETLTTSLKNLNADSEIRTTFFNKLVPVLYDLNQNFELSALSEIFGVDCLHSPENKFKILTAIQNRSFLNFLKAKDDSSLLGNTGTSHVYKLHLSLKNGDNVHELKALVDFISTNDVQYISSHDRLLTLAVIHIEARAKALALLDEALAIADNGFKRIQIYSLKKLIDETSLSSIEKIYLEGNKHLNEIQFFLKNDFYTNYVLRKLGVKNFFERNSSDCLVYRDQHTSLQNYSECDLNKNAIDLISGILIDENGEKNLLTEHRCKLVTLLFKSGKEGIHIESLTDQLFAGAFYHQQSTYLRLKNIISEINKIKIATKRKNNHYFFDFEKCPFNIISPLDSSCLGPLAYISRSHKVINRKIIEKELSIKPSTASLYLKNWKSMDLVIKSPENRFGDFHIKLV